MGRKSTVNESAILKIFSIVKSTRQTAEQLNIKINQVQ